jgi:hypothetical protein
VSSKRLADGLELSRIDDPALLQPVANHVSPISEINPRRESAAESRHQFRTPAPNMNMRGAVDEPQEKPIKTGAKIVSHGRYVAFQIGEVAIPRTLFADILRLIAELRPPPVISTA